MRPISIEDLERARRARELEAERAKRMQSVFVKTDALTDVALDAACQKREVRVVGQSKRSFGLALGLGLALATGGALAYGAHELPRWTTWVSEWVGSEKVAPRTSVHSESAPPEAALPEARSIAQPEVPLLEALGARTRTAPRAPINFTMPRPRTGDGAKISPSQTRNQPNEGAAERPNPAQSAGWGRLAAALSREQLHEAEAEAVTLSTQGTPEEREAAQLVAGQIQLKRDGFLSSGSRARLQELARRGVSENSRREAARLLGEHP
jgi:hypothetical protein